MAGTGTQHIACAQPSLQLTRRIVIPNNLGYLPEISVCPETLSPYLHTIPTLWNIFLNQDKHGVSFEEARAVSYDDHALEYYDPDHSQEETRFVLLGMSTSPDCWWYVTATVHRAE